MIADLMTAKDIDRFWVKVQEDPNGECWEWMAQLNDGYGYFKFQYVPRRAHIVAYELLVGPVPDGLQLDHTCRNRACVNPAHLEPVTHLENLLRGNAPWRVVQRQGKCQRGHLLVPENLEPRADRPGAFRCRICRAERYQASKVAV